MPKKSVFLDIGANIGMYTIFAAAVRNAEVIAIEPESQNFSILCKNIYINELENQIFAYCIAMSNNAGLSKLYLSEFHWEGGSSCHSLGKEVGFDLKPRRSPFAQGIASIKLDDAISTGAIPVPHAIKIDVDGFEHLVIKGALQTLSNPNVRTLCIEVNRNLDEHKEMLVQLEKQGFYYDQMQVAQSIRTEGAFIGCAEIIFDRIDLSSLEIVNSWGSNAGAGQVGSAGHSGSMAEAAFDEVLHKIKKTSVEVEPFPAIYLQDLFPGKYYAEMQRHFPVIDQMQPLGETGRVSEGAYPDRLVTLLTPEHFKRLNKLQRRFWEDFAAALTSDEFIQACVEKFRPWCSNRLAELRDRYGAVRVRSDALLVSDRTNYAIGPHTDLPHRLISFLFYLPKDDSLKYIGTSFYKHKDPAFVCPGGPHYKFEDFVRLGSAPFLPNSLLMFVRTGRSFHGVEPIKTPGVERRLLINNIRLIDQPSNC